MITALALLLGITITVPSEAKVRGQDVTLGEVARVENATPEQAARLAACPLGYAPAPGYARVVTRDEIARKASEFLAGVTIETRGADRCRLELETEVVTGTTLRAEAAKALDAAMVGRDVVVVADGAMPDLVVPRCETRLETRAQPNLRGLGTGTVTIPVQVWVDGAPYQTVQASFKVDLYENLPVLVTDVRRGEQLDARHVVLQRTKVDGALGGEPLAASAVTGATALHDLARGAVLTTRDVQRAVLVRRGDVVQLQVKKGPIVARVSAIAANDAGLGDKVRVTTTDSKRELSATVIGRGNVEVDLTVAQ